jgi:hypothetical protein
VTEITTMTKKRLNQMGKVELADHLRAVASGQRGEFFVYPEGMSDETVAAYFRERHPEIKASHVMGMRHVLGLMMREARHAMIAPAPDPAPDLFTPADLGPVLKRIDELETLVLSVSENVAEYQKTIAAEIERVGKNFGTLLAMVNHANETLPTICNGLMTLVASLKKGGLLVKVNEADIKTALLSGSLLDRKSRS